MTWVLGRRRSRLPLSRGRKQKSGGISRCLLGGTKELNSTRLLTRVGPTRRVQFGTGRHLRRFHRPEGPNVRGVADRAISHGPWPPGTGDPGNWLFGPGPAVGRGQGEPRRNVRDPPGGGSEQPTAAGGHRVHGATGRIRPFAFTGGREVSFPLHPAPRATNRQRLWKVWSASARRRAMSSARRPSLPSPAWFRRTHSTAIA